MLGKCYTTMLCLGLSSVISVLKRGLFWLTVELPFD